MAHALLLRRGAGGSIWSVARGLARNSTEYRARLANADAPRQGDFDGRGALSATHLEEFCAFFLRVCIDQVEFMGSLLQPGELLRRMKLYAVVRHGPDNGTATHPGALRIELLHRAGQRAAVGGQEPYPVADIEQDLRILGADRAGAIRKDRHSEAKRDDGCRIDMTWAIENISWMFGGAAGP